MSTTRLSEDAAGYEQCKHSAERFHPTPGYIQQARRHSDAKGQSMSVPYRAISLAVAILTLAAGCGGGTVPQKLAGIAPVSSSETLAPAPREVTPAVDPGVSPVSRSSPSAIVASSGRAISAQNVNQMEVLSTLKHHPSVAALSFDGQGNHLASVGSTFSVKLWDAITGQMVSIPIDQKGAAVHGSYLTRRYPAGHRRSRGHHRSMGPAERRD